MVFLSLLLIAVPGILVILGIVFICNSNPALKKKGKYLLLGGVLMILLEILIGFSICSGMNFH
jgi:uncharacterized membrane protein